MHFPRLLLMMLTLWACFFASAEASRTRKGGDFFPQENQSGTTIGSGANIQTKTSTFDVSGFMKGLQAGAGSRGTDFGFGWDTTKQMFYTETTPLKADG